MARLKGDGRGRMGGRAKGTPNKSTQRVRKWLEDFIQDQTETFKSDFEQLEAKERVKVFANLLPYVIPRAVEVEEQGEPPKMGLTFNVKDEQEKEQVIELLSNLR